MFDLFNSQKAKKYVMGGILVVVSASMLLYLVPNYNTGSGASDVIVAKIGSVEITETDARRSIQTQTRGQKIPPEIIPNYVPQMIETMVNDRAMEYEARKLGLKVGAWTVNAAADMRTLVKLDALCTDRPDVLKSILST